MQHGQLFKNADNFVMFENSPEALTQRAEVRGMVIGGCSYVNLYYQDIMSLSGVLRSRPRRKI